MSIRYEMDPVWADLVDMMDKRGEPAVVVFYGDHLPTMGLTEADMKSGSLFTRIMLSGTTSG